VRRNAPTLFRAEQRAKGIHLSENTAAGIGAQPDPGAGDAVLLFVGGPLDGRMDVRPAEQGEPLPTITHVYLHDGPKVVHRYDLGPSTGGAAVYTLRPPARKNSHEDSVAE